MKSQSLALGGLLVWGFSAADTSKESPDPFNAWLAKNAIRIRTVEPGSGLLDLQPLKAVVGKARIVALGEATHGAHEFLAFRNRLFEFLVKEMGFTAIAVESGFSESTEVDDYVLGGVADKKKMAQYVFAWAHIADRENLELIEWMRQYNAMPSTSRKIRFYGIDLTGGRAGEYTDSRRALDAALAYLNRVEPELAQKARGSLERFLPRFNTDGYKNLAPDERDTLTAAIGDLVNLFKSQRIAFLARGEEADYHRAYRHAVVARQLDADFRGVSPRDFAMAENVRWALEREGPHGRILVFAHNYHVKKGPSRLLQMPEMEGKPPLMGEYLRSELGNQMVVLGSTASQGWFRHGLCVTTPSSIGGLLSRVGLPLFFLDLRACLGGPFAQAFNRVMNFWVNGTHYDGLNPAECFDALLFVKKLRGAKPIELGCFLGCFYFFFTCRRVGADLLRKFLTSLQQKGAKPFRLDAILENEVKCLQPQPNSTILRAQQSQIHFISQHRIGVKEGKFEYSTVHEVLNPSGEVIHSETIKGKKIKGAVESISEFDFLWRFPTDLAEGKYQYKIQAIIVDITELPLRRNEVKTTTTIDFFIK